jgi:hypothetical protein
MYILAKRLGRHRSLINCLVVKSKNLPRRVIPRNKKGSGGVKEWRRLKTIGKRHVFKYPMMTTTELWRSVVKLQMISEETIQQTVPIDLKMPSQAVAITPLLT